MLKNIILFSKRPIQDYCFSTTVPPSLLYPFKFLIPFSIFTIIPISMLICISLLEVSRTPSRPAPWPIWDTSCFKIKIHSSQPASRPVIYLTPAVLASCFPRPDFISQLWKKINGCEIKCGHGKPEYEAKLVYKDMSHSFLKYNLYKGFVL